jgi:ATP-binding cassette subfamily B protein
MIQRASASQKRLNEFLDTVPVILNNKSNTKITSVETIEFRNVNFVYPHTGIKALTNFNLSIAKGEKVVLVGRTGSGKSTIAQLLLRLYDPTTGQILVNGMDIREIDLGSLRRQISYVPQDVFLFSDSVSNNISFSDFNSTVEEIQNSARYAVVDKEIGSFSEGYDTMIGERGVTLSGGQKQRLSIARALNKKAGVLLFDDCLSAVDARTEKQILSNLHDFMEDKTAIIITHRVFSLFDFNKIIVLEDGTIVEQGGHQQLMALNGYYTDMFQQGREGENEAVNGSPAK